MSQNPLNMQSSNPTLKDAFKLTAVEGDAMTVRGTLTKFAIGFALLFASAAFTWKAGQDGVNIIAWLMPALIVGLGLAFLTVFKKTWSPFLMPVYALAQGVVVGGISVYTNDMFQKTAPNIVMEAVGLTFGVVLVMLALYSFRIIRASQTLIKVIVFATAGIAIYYLISLLAGAFGYEVPLIHENTWQGILFSLVVVVVAALNLILDFHYIEEGSRNGAPKYMEWYGAFGLLVTIIWLYLELLRLLSKVYGRK